MRSTAFDYDERAKQLAKEFYREGSYHDIVIYSTFRDEE